MIFNSDNDKLRKFKWAQLRLEAENILEGGLFMKPEYCTNQQVTTCEECAFVSYGRDCQNKRIPEGDRIETISRGKQGGKEMFIEDSWVIVPEELRGLIRKALKAENMKVPVGESEELRDLNNLQAWVRLENGQIGFLFKEG